MPRERPRKRTTVCMRVSDDLLGTLEYLKMMPGGLSGWFDRKLREVEVDAELYRRLKTMG